MPSVPPRVSGEVQAALHAGLPVVALESTLLAHGLPSHRRIDAYERLRAAVEAGGAVPALVAVVAGQPRIGLTDEELASFLAANPAKASLADLPVALALGGNWATTVASTMALASLAGVRAFATGGIGGVHREVLETFDESSDLTALARYPLVVVSAGAKAILDLPRTMERLETLGVPVIGWRTRELPAFYHGESGIPLRHSVDTLSELARIARVRFQLPVPGGLLVVQPPPPELAQEPKVIEALIQGALLEARVQGVRGSALTPFLLATLDRVSQGSVVETNLGLVEANARLAAELAAAL